MVDVHTARLINRKPPPIPQSAVFLLSLKELTKLCSGFVIHSSGKTSNGSISLQHKMAVVFSGSFTTQTHFTYSTQLSMEGVSFVCGAAAVVVSF